MAATGKNNESLAFDSCDESLFFRMTEKKQASGQGTCRCNPRWQDSGPVHYMCLKPGCLGSVRKETGFWLRGHQFFGYAYLSCPLSRQASHMIAMKM